MDVKPGFLSPEQAKKILGVSDSTLRQWAKNGTISCIRNGEKSHRYYNVKEYIDKQKPTDTPVSLTTRRKICYCRVSTRKQKPELLLQTELLRQQYPDYEYITDIGSGTSFKRAGLKTILEYAVRGEIERIVVAHKDRLCRFGFDLVKWIVTEFSRGEILVLKSVECSPEHELVNDLLSVIKGASARIPQLKPYTTQIHQHLQPQPVEIVFTD